MFYTGAVQRPDPDLHLLVGNSSGQDTCVLLDLVWFQFISGNQPSTHQVSLCLFYQVFTGAGTNIYTPVNFPLASGSSSSGERSLLQSTIIYELQKFTRLCLRAEDKQMAALGCYCHLRPETRTTRIIRDPCQPSNDLFQGKGVGVGCTKCHFSIHSK